MIIKSYLEAGAVRRSDKVSTISAAMEILLEMDKGGQITLYTNNKILLRRSSYSTTNWCFTGWENDVCQLHEVIFRYLAYNRTGRHWEQPVPEELCHRINLLSGHSPRYIITHEANLERVLLDSFGIKDTGVRLQLRQLPLLQFAPILDLHLENPTMEISDLLAAVGG